MRERLWLGATLVSFNARRECFDSLPRASIYQFNDSFAARCLARSKNVVQNCGREAKDAIGNCQLLAEQRTAKFERIFAAVIGGKQKLGGDGGVSVSTRGRYS
jgi:hypothetical protein